MEKSVNDDKMSLLNFAFLTKIQTPVNVDTPIKEHYCFGHDPKTYQFRF